MSDYMFMLESHLSSEQMRVVTLLQQTAAEANVSLFLTGGAMRDMLGAFPIRDLDFTVEGPALKLAKVVSQRSGAETIETDDNRKIAHLRFPGGARAELSMARVERYARPGGKPQVTPATIHEHLRGRDFTINAIGLSLNRASRGLIIDPTNGISDLDQHQLRCAANYALYDQPIRLLRLLRFRVRLGFTVDERTESQYRNARDAGLETHISAHALLDELRHIAEESNPGEVLRLLEEERLLGLYSPVLAGPKLNLAGFQKLTKAKQLLPFGVDLRIDHLAIFLSVLSENLSPKEKAALAKAVGMGKEDLQNWQRLETKSAKLEKELKSPRLNRPSQVYHALVKAPGEQILFLLMRSQQRLVQDRIRNYLQRYVITAQEVSDAEVAAEGIKPGTPKFQKAKNELIAARLDARPKKVPPPAEAPPPAPVSAARVR
jgi:tRNA nucleotidyltransferase (CCA-adding enzyme)